VSVGGRGGRGEHSDGQPQFGDIRHGSSLMDDDRPIREGAAAIENPGCGSLALRG